LVLKIKELPNLKLPKIEEQKNWTTEPGEINVSIDDTA
jgi:hypothetical protein